MSYRFVPLSVDGVRLRPRILALIEHPEHVAEVKRCLRYAGNEVCLVDSFTKAIAILKNHSFDLIISDVHLENDGSVFDFLKWIKNDRRSRRSPFVLFSLEPSDLAKYFADGVSIAARCLGAAKYISMEKFDPSLLNEEIAELLPDRIATHALETKARVFR
jgi:CheY-like chemotaxis protein